MNFAETAVKDHSAEQRPKPCWSPPPARQSQPGLGLSEQEFPWSRNGPQTRFLAQHWGEVKLQWHSSNHSRESPTGPGSGLVCSAVPQILSHSHVPFTEPTKPRSKAPASQQLGNCWHQRQEENHHCNVEGTEGCLAWAVLQWELSKAETIPMHTTMSGFIPVLPGSSQIYNLLLLLIQTLQSPSLNSA